MILFEKYSVYYKVKKEWYLALNEIDLHVAPGEVVLVSGPSGSGKTTLLRSILGLSEKFSGKLLVDGQEVTKENVGKLGIGYVSQEYSLYPSMTVYENIAYPLTLQQTPLEEIKVRVKSAAELVDLLPLLTRKPRQLSGGQQQRLALARALCKRPRILLLDEPFSNQHPEETTELYGIIARYHAACKPTILFATHDLFQARPFADRVIELDEGCLVRPRRTRTEDQPPKEE